MNALFLTLFVSIVLALGGVLLFAFGFAQRDHEHADRLSLLPLHDDTAYIASAAASAPQQPAEALPLLHPRTEET